MKNILLYLLLFSFWVDNATDFVLSQTKGLSLINLVIYFLLFIWAFKALLNRKWFEPNKINRYLVLMIFIVTISIPVKMLLGEVQNITLSEEIITLKNWCEPLLLFFILYNSLETEKDCQRAITALLVLFICTLLSMFLVSFGIMEIGRLKVSTGEYHPGRSSGFGDYNDYASYLVLFIPLILSSFLFQKISFKKVGSVMLLLMALTGLIITGSRGGILSFLFSLVVYIVILNREKMINFRAVVFVGLALILLGVGSFSLAPSQVKKTLEKKFNPDFGNNIDEYTSGRTLILAGGLSLFMESPIYGHGQISFIPLMIQRFRIKAAAHNRYLLYMVEYGVLGLAVYIMIFVKIYQLVRNHIKACSEFRIKLLYISYLAGFSGYTFSLLGVDANVTRFIFWIYAAIILKYIQIRSFVAEDFERAVTD